MALSSDRKALLFLGIVALLGTGVRLFRARAPASASSGHQSALALQLQRADSAAQSGRGKGPGRDKGRGKGRGQGPGRDKGQGPGKGSAKKAPSGPRSAKGRATTPTPLADQGDRPGYLRGKLDLDVATAEQIETLPRVGKALSRRIVADRAIHGPFVNKDGLRRVRGINRSVLAAIDTLVAYSGTIRTSW